MTISPSSSTRSMTVAMASSSLSNSDRRPGRRHRSPTSGSSIPTGIRSGSFADRPVRRGLDRSKLAIPFKSLRYGPAARRSGDSTFNGITRGRTRSRRSRRCRPRWQTRGPLQLSLAATLVGLEAPPGSKNLEIKPYVVSDLTTDRTMTPAIVERCRRRCRHRREIRRHAEPDGRFHLQHRLRPGRSRRAADQSHAIQPVLPGKARVLSRESGTFAFGGTSGSGGAGDTPILFYSRRIGLHQERDSADPGGRPSNGPRGPVQSGSAQHSVRRGAGVRARRRRTSPSLRVKRDILRRSSIGSMYTRRSVSPNGGGRTTRTASTAPSRFSITSPSTRIGRETPDAGPDGRG